MFVFSPIYGSFDFDFTGHLLQAPLSFLRATPAGVSAFDLEGQMGEVGTSLENAHDGVIHDPYKHAMLDERAGDSAVSLDNLSGMSPPCQLWDGSARTPATSAHLMKRSRNTSQNSAVTHTTTAPSDKVLTTHAPSMALRTWE